DGNYANATGTGSLVISPLPQTITFPSPGDQTFGTPPFALAAHASSGLRVSFSIPASSDSDACIVSGATVTFVKGGRCAILARQSGNSQYAAATDALVAFRVLPAAQTIAFAQPPDVSLGMGAVTLKASATSGLPVTFASSSPGTCSASGATVTLLQSGACQVTARQAGNYPHLPLQLTPPFRTHPPSQPTPPHP